MTSQSITKKEFLKYLRGLIKRIEPKLPARAPELEMMEITFTEIRHVYTTEVCAEKEGVKSNENK